MDLKSIARYQIHTLLWIEYFHVNKYLQEKNIFSAILIILQSWFFLFSSPFVNFCTACTLGRHLKKMYCSLFFMCWGDWSRILRHWYYDIMPCFLYKKQTHIIQWLPTWPQELETKGPAQFKQNWASTNHIDSYPCCLQVI